MPQAISSEPLLPPGEGGPKGRMRDLQILKIPHPAASRHPLPWRERLALRELFRVILQKVDKVASAGIVVGMIEHFGSIARTRERHGIHLADARFRTIRH